LPEKAASDKERNADIPVGQMPAYCSRGGRESSADSPTRMSALRAKKRRWSVVLI
jgi:hypothetical protein